MKIPFNPARFRYHALRQALVQPVFWCLFLLGAVLDIFRVDMIAQRLVVWGKAYPFVFETLLWLPVGFYAAVIGIGVVSFLWGRLFCGWACPHNTMSEWTRPFRAVISRDKPPLPIARLFQRRPLIKKIFNAISFPLALAITYLFAIFLSAYVVSPDWILSQYASGQPHIALISGHFLFALIGLFLLYAGHDFCRTCCPYGMAQALSAYQEGKWRPMEIRFQGAPFTENTAFTKNLTGQSTFSPDCQTCTACQSVCPVDIDPRKPENLKVGQFNGCFNCGECIDACKSIQIHKNRDGLLLFELPWQRQQREKKSSTTLT